MISTPVHDQQAVDDLLLPILEHLEKGDLDIPVLPHVASQILALTSDPDADSSKLTALLHQDPVLASRIFKIANSPAYYSRYPIESLQQAVSWLGLNCLSQTAFAVSIQSGIFNVHGYGQEVKTLWGHALATALYAKNIAERIGVNPDNAFLCGLLHAIGKPFVIHTVNQYRQDFEAPVPWSVMVEVINGSYVEVGRRMGEDWGLPAPVKEAIVLHEDCAYHLSTCATKGAVVTSLASHLATFLLNPSATEESALLSLPVVSHLHVSQEDMADLLGMKDSIWTMVEPLLS